MTNLTRKNQKVFASGASNNGQFGSLQATTKVLSNDVETLQALAAYEAGWNSAVVSGEQLPSLEEFQGLNYINTYQIGYLLQKGLPEWNADTTYYIGDLAREVGGNKIYTSITDNNTGNALTNPANWELYSASLKDLIINKKLNLAAVNSEEIASGSVSYVGVNTTLRSEGAAATDDLDNITDGTTGDIVLLKTVGATEIITIRDNGVSGGNIALPNSNPITLSSTGDFIMLIFRGSFWYPIAIQIAEQNVSLKELNYQPQSATISAGSIPYSGAYMVVDTEGGASIDDLETISGGSVGDVVKIRSNVNGRDVTIKSSTGNILLPNDKDVTLSRSENFIELVFIGSFWAQTSRSVTNDPLFLLPPKAIELSNGTDADHDIDFTAGNFYFYDGSGQGVMTAKTGELDAAFGTGNGMLDTGTIAADSTYYLFAVYNPTTGDAKPLASLSKTSPTMTLPDADGYTILGKRIAALRTDGSANIRTGSYLFSSNGSYKFFYDTRITNYSGGAITSTQSIEVAPDSIALVSGYMSSGSGWGSMRVKQPSSNNYIEITSHIDSGGASNAAGNCQVLSNSSAQIDVNFVNSGGGNTFNLYINGWEEYLS